MSKTQEGRPSATGSFVIAKRGEGRIDVFHSRAGSTPDEAWTWALDSLGKSSNVTRAEFARNGWKAKRVYVLWGDE